jgi:hypothetical protein
MTEATVDMAYAKSIVEAVEQGCNYEDKCLAVRDLLARHRQASVPVQGEPVAWMYSRDGTYSRIHKSQQPSRYHGWTETPLYTHAPTERERVLLEALKAAESAIAEYYRYWTGGETRGSYDGKPERAGLWEAQRKARAAIAQAQEPE